MLGLPRRHAIPRELIENRYLEFATAVHPDRFVGESLATRREAQEVSSRLNEGYRILRDPIARAEYMVKLAGIDLDSSDPTTGAPAPEPAFLVEMIERREALAEARASGSSRVDAFRAQVEDEVEGELDRAVAALEIDEPSRAARALVAHRYLQRLLQDVDGQEIGV